MARAHLFYYDPETLKGVSDMTFFGSPLPPMVPGQPYVEITGLGLDIEDPSQWSISPEGVVAKTGRPVRTDEVNEERDRRINGGFTFQGHLFDCDTAARQNISGAATLAIGAMASGALPGNLQWHGAVDDFAWLAQDNVVVTMDAPSVFAFGAEAAEHVRVHVFAARVLKDMAQIPHDYQDDSHWPS
jgi:hypothetical protein